MLQDGLAQSLTGAFSIHSVDLNDDSLQGQQELIVKLKKALNQALPLHDYRIALQCAVSWLGDRYLLAAPVRRVCDDRKPYFAETRSWFPTTRQ